MTVDTLIQVEDALDGIRSIENLKARLAHCGGFYDSLLDQYDRNPLESNQVLLRLVSIAYEDIYKLNKQGQEE